jgi:hypothetical protein
LMPGPVEMTNAVRVAMSWELLTIEYGGYNLSSSLILSKRFNFFFTENHNDIFLYRKCLRLY